MAGARRLETASLYDQGETVRIRGLDTWVVRAGPAAGGTPIVFLHGVPTSAYLYREVMRAMHEERACVSFDWPGFGQSEKPRELDLSHRARAEHLAATLDHLGLARVHLVGHDVGALAAMLLALDEPHRVERLVLLNTTLFKRDFRPPLPMLLQMVPVLREVSRPFLTRPAFDFFFKEGLAHPERLPPAVLENHWRLASADGGAHYVLEAWKRLAEDVDALERMRARLGALDQPTLVLFGARDPYLPPANAERLAKALPHATLEMLPDAGHFLQEDAPEQVAERLMAFLG